VNPSPLKVAVVGHTNTGKTSLLRTLTRDVGFGEVSDRPATTRHVEGARLLVDGRPVIELYDTPGLEDSIGLLDELESRRGGRRGESIELIQAFLEGESAHGRFAQESKAIRQVLASDVALYVIDARDAVLAKHRDELAILSFCSRPVVPVLNFIASPEAQTSNWREHLSRAGMHAVAEFDTVVIDELAEQRLYEKMRSLLDGFRPELDALIDDRRAQRERLIASSSRLISEMLIDVASCAIDVEADNATSAGASLERFKRMIRAREEQLVRDLLALHRFRPDDVLPADFPLAAGQWGIDLFSPEALKHVGLNAGGGAAAGALAGLTIDAMVGGLTLGAAAGIGAIIGAVLGAGRARGRQLVNRARGYTELRCDDLTLELLMARALTLAHALLHRGHAGITPLKLDGASSHHGRSDREKRSLPAELREARVHPQWSSLAPAAWTPSFDSGREQARTRLALHVRQRLADRSLRPQRQP
jgi:GTPase Era involved in 16S rRNA processing